MNRWIRTVVFWVFVFIAAVLLWQVVRAAPEERIPEISYSRFLSDVDAGAVESVTIGGTQIHGLYRDGKGAFRLRGPSNPSLYMDELRSKNVEIRFRDVESNSLALTLLGTWAPLILLGVLWVYMIRYLKRARSPKQAEPPSGTGSAGPPTGPVAGNG